VTGSHPSLRHAPSDLIGGRWIPIPGDGIVSINPARPAEVVWSATPRIDHVDLAVAAARAAAPAWARFPLERRAAVLRRFQKIAVARVDDVTDLLRDEVGKPTWDAKAEAQLLAAKVDITLDEGPDAALGRVRGFEAALTPTRTGRAWFRPHGVMAVLGPFNFPAHLPNGHIVPALAMGNTVVLKPSDKTPAAGQILAEMFDEALVAEGAPSGVLNLVQGGADIAARLSAHADIDGVLFTGSWAVGRRIMQANLDRPGRILALEMGGNNPAIILPDADLRQAVIECVRCAFITSGQRCTCTRRVIVHRAIADRVVSAIVRGAAALTIGAPDADPPVFMGPVISRESRDAILTAQDEMRRAGGEAILPMRATDGPGGGWYVTPGVMRVDRFVETPAGAKALSHAGADVEVFGPLLRISVVDSLDEAITQANATAFGLAASIFTHDAAAIERFHHEAHAGCVNVNTGTAGASGKLPFGGLGLSGNHRPAGAFSIDYCAYPVAGMFERESAALVSPGMTVDEAWFA